MKLNAFHLPGLPDPPTTTWTFGEPGAGVDLRIPRLSEALLARQVDALLSAREATLTTRPVGSVVAVIERVALRFLDREDPLRTTAETALTAVTGLSHPMVSHILDGMASDWRSERLEALLRAELGDPRVLEGFTQVPELGKRALAIGPSLAFHVFSGNVPGVSVTSLIRVLLVGGASLGKSAGGEPILAPLFARAVAEADPALGACLAVAYWPGGDEALEKVALDRADLVIAYGGRAAIDALRPRVPPGRRFIGYGNRVSFGVVAREAASTAEAEGVAAGAALAVATFDQQGCVSPHLFYVEEGGELSARDWARELARQMERLEATFPRGTVTPGEAAAIRQARGEAEFGQLSGKGQELHASEGTSWTVIFDPSPTFTPSCLNRVVRVKPVSTLAAIPDQLRGLQNLLQTVGVAGPADRLEGLVFALARAGVSRITPIGRMAWPPGSWRHDGHPPLGQLVRWCDWEEG